MTQNHFFIVCVLLAIEIFILVISSHRNFKRYFQLLPSVFWIYFLPMLASTLGVIDGKNPLYAKLTTYLLPPSLFILLMTVDVRAILRLGKIALIMFFAGSLGIVLGAPLVFSLFKKWIGADFWSGFGALSGSWSGGSANMIAVKESLNVPDPIFLPMVVVDTVVPYFWMGILVALSGLQIYFDRWNRSDRAVLDELGQRVATIFIQEKKIRFGATILILALAAFAGYLAQFLAEFLPVIEDMISTYAWTIILVSFLGISLSFTPARNLERFHSTKIGYFLLYFVLTSIGARADLSNIPSSAILILAGFLIVFIHFIFLLTVAKMIKAPFFLVATASQANIGGVASAPIVAEIYQSGLASVGLLLAILGNIVGTYFGIIAGQLCRAFSSG
ncbi:MAG: DUF819 family protein [Candidatus Omnitrophota bacterium]